MANPNELEQQIEQMRARLQQLEAETKSREQQMTQTASRKAREIVSRAEAEAKTIEKKAWKDYKQISRDECSAVVTSKQQMQREVEALKKEKALLANELSELNGRVNGMMQMDAPEEPAVEPAQPTEAAQPQPVEAPQPQPAEVPQPQPTEVPQPVVVEPQQPTAVDPQQPTAPIEQVFPAVDPDQQKTSEEQFKEALLEKPKKKRWKAVLATIIIVILLAVLAFELLLGVTKMRDDAMEPGVHEGARILYSRISKQPHTNDLTVFENKAGLVCVRRAIARGGDTVDYNATTNEILVNGKAIPNVPSDVEWWGVEDAFEFPITVQDGEVFVLAANRDRATNEGLIKVDQVKGKALKIF